MRQLNRAAETTTSGGTGDLTLLGALTGYQSLASIGNGNRFPYLIREYPAAINWEVGIGTYVTGPARLQRTTILASSNGGAAVNWGSGDKVVTCGLPADLSLLNRHEAKAAGFTAGAADVGKVFECSGTFTAAYSAAATLGAGWWCVMVNKSGVQTHDPNASETIDGVATFATAVGENILVYCDGAELHTVGRRTTVSLPRGYLHGLTLSNNVTDATNDIDIATGVARDSTDADNMILAAAITKRLDANWAVGTNQGGLDTGAVANGTYHVWLIKRSDTGVVDVLFSTSASAPTMPANYTHRRRIGSILRESAAIVPFVQDYAEFTRKTPVLDLSANTIGTAANLRTLSVPAGIKVLAKFSHYYRNQSGVAGNYFNYFSDPEQADLAPALNVAPGASGSDGAALDLRVWADKQTRTNTSRQIRQRAGDSNASATLYIVTHGWIDEGIYRG